MHPNHLDYEVKVGDQFPGFSPRVGNADLARRPDSTAARLGALGHIQSQGISERNYFGILFY
jgi:hypothetical protein